MVSVDLRLRWLAGEILRLDEVLTMSARMAAATGDRSWERRYREHEPLLNELILEARALAPEANLASTDEANVALVVVRRFWRKVAFEDAISCHHNYVAEERHYDEDLLVTRKGAIRAGAGELGIIPGSMGAKSFIVRGKGNPASFESASHGAGRLMSRTEARRRFTVRKIAIDISGFTGPTVLPRRTVAYDVETKRRVFRDRRGARRRAGLVGRARTAASPDVHRAE
jgi:hypothetical protein